MTPLNVELPDLRAVIAVSEGRRFLRAAGQLDLSQAALSGRVQKLEALVGTPLLRRLLHEIDSSLLGMMARLAGRAADRDQHPGAGPIGDRMC